MYLNKGLKTAESQSGIGQGSQLANSRTANVTLQPHQSFGSGAGSLSQVTANSTGGQQEVQSCKNSTWKSQSSMYLRNKNKPIFKASSRDKLPGISIH